MLTSID